jgi:HEAT repeat protein
VLGFAAAGSAQTPYLNLLIGRLENPDASTHDRYRAAKDLGHTKDLHAIEPLTTAILRDPDPGVVSVAATALAEIKNVPCAAEPLIAALKSDEPTRRLNTVAALDQIKGPCAVEPMIIASLTALEADPDADVRRAAADTLGISTLSSAIFRSVLTFDAADHALGRMRDLRAVEPDSDTRVRGELAKVLGQINDTRALEILIAVLESSDTQARREAAAALGQIEDTRTVEALIAALKDPDISLRENAADAFRLISDPRATDPLIAALRDSDVWVRITAAEALGKIRNPQAVEPLIAALKDIDFRVRNSAVGALGQIGDLRCGRTADRHPEILGF